MSIGTKYPFGVPADVVREVDLERKNIKARNENELRRIRHEKEVDQLK